MNIVEASVREIEQQRDVMATRAAKFAGRIAALEAELAVMTEARAKAEVEREKLRAELEGMKAAVEQLTPPWAACQDGYETGE